MDIEEYREKHWAWKILLLDVSVFVGGALIAIVIFALLFFILNYFNIISLSIIYKPLALLPRSPRLSSGEAGQTKTKLQTNSALQNFIPKITPTPIIKINTSLSTTEKQQLNNIAQNFVDSLMLADYRKKVQFNERFFSKEIPIPSLTDTWSNNLLTATLSAQYDYRKREPVILDVVITGFKESNVVSESSINQILLKYLTLSSDIKFSCTTLGVAGNIQCNNMSVQNDKSKIGISLNGSSKNIFYVALCKTLPNSNRYSWDSCLHE